MTVCCYFLCLLPGYSANESIVMIIFRVLDLNFILYFMEIEKNMFHNHRIC